MSDLYNAVRTAKNERELEHVLSAIDRADLEELLAQGWGRRVYSRIVFRLCGIETETFHPEIKDGLSAALMGARDEGARWVGLQLAREAAVLRPDLWAQLNIERWNAASEEAHLRDKARKVEREREL